jgi:hypothetical protein
LGKLKEMSDNRVNINKEWYVGFAGWSKNTFTSSEIAKFEDIFCIESEESFRKSNVYEFIAKYPFLGKKCLESKEPEKLSSSLAVQSPVKAVEQRPRRPFPGNDDSFDFSDYIVELVYVKKFPWLD